MVYCIIKYSTVPAHSNTYMAIHASGLTHVTLMSLWVWFNPLLKAHTLADGA